MRLLIFLTLFSSSLFAQKKQVSAWNMNVNLTETVALAGDVAVTGTTFSDVAGLSFAVESGVSYNFSALIIYDAAQTISGAKWAVSFPTISSGAYYTICNATNTTFTEWAGNTADGGALSPTSLLAGNIALIEGTITTSAAGTLKVRLACEVSGANGQITCKKGSLFRVVKL